MNDLKNLFIDQLQDMYDAEHRLTEAIPKKIEAAKSEELKDGLKKHLEETKQQVKRLEQVFDKVGSSAKRNTCEGTKGLIEEAEALINDFKGSDALDAAIVCAAQKVEHYEIASYGCLRSWAKTLGLSEAEDLLAESLQEEKHANETLNEVAKAQANLEASGASK